MRAHSRCKNGWLECWLWKCQGLRRWCVWNPNCWTCTVGERSAVTVLGIVVTGWLARILGHRDGEESCHNGSGIFLGGLPKLFAASLQHSARSWPSSRGRYAAFLPCYGRWRARLVFKAGHGVACSGSQFQCWFWLSFFLGSNWLLGTVHDPPEFQTAGWPQCRMAMMTGLALMATKALAKMGTFVRILLVSII